MLVLAVVVAVAVLARMSSSPTTAASSTHHNTTTTPAKVAATTSTTAGTTSTTLPATTTTTLPPSSVLVLVLNGWTTEHAALFYKNQLAPVGYDLRAPADAATDDNTVSEVFYTHPQYEAVAASIAARLGLLPSRVLAPIPADDSALTTADIAAADVIVLVGEDISGKVPVGYET